MGRENVPVLAALDVWATDGVIERFGVLARASVSV